MIIFYRGGGLVRSFRECFFPHTITCTPPSTFSVNLTNPQDNTMNTIKLSVEDAIKATLTSFPNVREIPVRNVAHWPNDVMANALNLEQDKRAYGWQGEQLKAIKLVLELQHKL